MPYTRGDESHIMSYLYTNLSDQESHFEAELMGTASFWWWQCKRPAGNNIIYSLELFSLSITKYIKSINANLYSRIEMQRKSGEIHFYLIAYCRTNSNDIE
jgi:hypothetical protein